MPTTSQPLLAAYGGGHASIVAAIASSLIRSGCKPTIVGFTTGYQALLRENLEVQNVSALIEGQHDAYEPFAELARPYLPDRNHPGISDQETRDYFAIGLHDLVDAHGEERALALIEQEGRGAFEPITTMQAYLEKLNPSCIVTTTSPRFELALVRAGKRMGIPTVAIADIFLQRERSWVLSGNYSDHLCVLNEPLKAELLAEGLGGDTRVYATGNPAFDALAVVRSDPDLRRELRRELGISDKILILWPSASVRQAEFTDRPFATPERVVAAFEPLCAARPDYAYMLRPHPNAPHGLPQGATHGLLDPGLTPEAALMVADVVCFEVSTMGLQAHLAGLPTICVGFPEIAVFPRYGHGLTAANLGEAAAQLAMRDQNALERDAACPAKIVSASDTIASLIMEISYPSVSELEAR